MHVNTTKHCRRQSGLRRSARDSGQTALVMVIAVTILLTTFGAIMVNVYTNNAPILAKASLKRYAYRALASGLNAYTSAINANPYLADCNTAQTANGNPECAAITYQTWTQIEGTNTGNGVIPQLYMFDNPQEVTSSTTGAVTDLEVQIVGAAGFPGNYVYYSTIAHFVPANDFLNNVWWSNYESSDFPNANASDCNHFWQPTNVGGAARNANNLNCTAVQWQSGDQVYGPVFSNDSLYTSGTPSFTGTVTTADPSCEFVGNPNSPSCTTDTPPTYGHALEVAPVDNTELRATAIQGGCDYQGPTTVTFNKTGNAMTVVSKLSAGYPGNLTQTQPGTDTSTCPTDGSGAFPKNGVIYVDAATPSVSSAANPNSTSCLANNPLYSGTSGLSQVSNCRQLLLRRHRQPRRRGRRLRR